VEDIATPADMTQRQEDQIAHARECLAKGIATKEQVAYLRNLP